MIVISANAAIRRLGPANPIRSPWMICSRSSHWVSDAALRFVCGSSISTQSGRLMIDVNAPSGPCRMTETFSPRMFPVIPQAWMITPPHFAPSISANTMCVACHSSPVGLPLYVWSLARCATPRTARTGTHISG